MRKVLGWILVTLGVFLLVVGLVAVVWGIDASKRTPLDVNTVTHLSGTADKLNPSTGKVEHLNIKATNTTKTDSTKSTGNVVVWVSVTCVLVDVDNPPDCVKADDPQNRLIDASTDVFATDRTTAVAVNGSQYLPADAVPHEGLVNKWPFDSQKKTYDYWDGTLGKTVPARYTGTTSVDGLDCYVYQISVNQEPAEVVTGVQGLYSNEATITVEPQTGAIVDEKQHVVRTLKNGDPLIDLTLAYTPEQVNQSVADSKDSLQTLHLVTRVAPLAGFIGGPLLLIAGILLLVLGRRSRTSDELGAHRG